MLCGTCPDWDFENGSPGSWAIFRNITPTASFSLVKFAREGLVSERLDQKLLVAIARQLSDGRRPDGGVLILEGFHQPRMTVPGPGHPDGDEDLQDGEDGVDHGRA